ncbi:MAG: ABC transporter ATP-binding protein [Synergistaceae bacterium]|nr:ABC transporter ATP-binding protein [Synergistaceae bacterium]
MALLELKNVTKRFGGLTAVEALDLDVQEHQIAALIGPNGAGKTTVFNMITGAYHVTEGSVTFNGTIINDEKSYNAMKPHKIVELGIARTFQNIRLFKKMSVLDNVMTGFHSVSKAGMFNIIFKPRDMKLEEDENRAKAMKILEFLKLQNIASSLAGGIPYGTQRLLEIGRALVTKPKLLLLDEPAAGMNSSEKKALVKTIRGIRDEYNLAVLLVEHDMELVMDISEDITVVNFGRRIAHGTASEVQANEDVIEAYLGRSDD